MKHIPYQKKNRWGRANSESSSSKSSETDNSNFMDDSNESISSFSSISSSTDCELEHISTPSGSSSSFRENLESDSEWQNKN